MLLPQPQISATTVLNCPVGSLCEGQQTLSEEVSEKTHSRMLRLEKENQSLLKTIKELRASSATSSGVSVDAQRISSEVTQTSCRPPENHSNGSMQSPMQERILNGDTKVAQRVIVLEDEVNFHTPGAGDLNDRGDPSNCIMSELEVLENDLNRRLSSAGSSGGTLSGSNSSGPSCPPQGPSTRPSYSDKHTQRLEAKCRAMDTFNQHLQTSLDTTGRSSSSADWRPGEHKGLSIKKKQLFFYVYLN